jgi:hypothetical protein
MEIGALSVEYAFLSHEKVNTIWWSCIYYLLKFESYWIKEL